MTGFVDYLMARLEANSTIRMMNAADLFNLKLVWALWLSLVFTKHDRKLKPIQEAEDFYVKKVLLLVTDIEDVIAILNEPRLPVSTKYKIIRGYSKGSPWISSIIRLLPYIRKGVHKSQFNDFKGHRLEKKLLKRAQELIASDKNQLSVVNICYLAGLITDPYNDGSGSKSAEDIVIDMAMPKVENDFALAIQVAKSFGTISGRHRFLSAYMEAYGLQDTRQAVTVAEIVEFSQFGGAELAKKLLEISEQNRFDLIYTDIVGLKILSGFQVLDLPKHLIHPDMQVMDCNPDIGIVRIKGKNGPEATTNLENILRRYADAGRLDCITIHGLPVMDFVEIFGKELAPDVRGMVERVVGAQ